MIALVLESIGGAGISLAIIWACFTVEPPADS
jgi:hypothetical protein